MCVYLIWTYRVLPTEAPSAVSVAGDSDGEVGLYYPIAMRQCSLCIQVTLHNKYLWTFKD